MCVHMYVRAGVLFEGMHDSMIVLISKPTAFASIMEYQSQPHSW